MGDLEYTLITVEHRRTEVENRLRGLEAAHYNARLDLIAAVTADAIAEVRHRLDKLEVDIVAFREEEAGLMAMANGNPN